MPDFKKKNVKKRKRNIKNAVSDNIIMRESVRTRDVTDKKRYPPKDRKTANINIIRGNKIIKRKKRIVSIIICGLLSLLILLISLLTPTGIIESLINLSASVKFGSNYPVKLSGGALINTVSQGNHSFLVSTTKYECYNNNGKNIFSYQHGYQSPIVSVSDARTLLYDQSGKNFSIYNLKSELVSGQTDNDILAANITRNGYYAIATLSDSYSSQVTVYSNRNEKVYEWFCSDYIINSVILSPDGKTLAVSAFSALNGAFVSKVYFLEYSSATPKAQFDYNTLVLSLNNSGNKGFICVFENNVDFFTWNKLKCNSFATENNILISKSYKSNILIVSGRLANKNENIISIFDAQGKLKHSFVFNSIIDEIEFKGTNIYILSENNVYNYTLSGELINKTSCDFGTSFILPISQTEIAVVTDNNIKKINFKE